jgi:hypothetical protein
MLQEHQTDHEPSWNLPHTFHSPKTFPAVRLNVFQWLRSIYCLQQASTQMVTSQWSHWQCVVATTSSYHRILECCAYYAEYFCSWPAFFF